MVIMVEVNIRTDINRDNINRTNPTIITRDRIVIQDSIGMTTTTEATRVINQVAIEVVEVEVMVEAGIISPKEIEIE